MPHGKPPRLEDLSREELLEKLRKLFEAGSKLEGPAEATEERTAHDLHVHQVELEVQNRALREAQASLEQSRSRYVELYDFAPVAYATLDPKGCIQEINLTGVTMLGGDRSQLIGLPFLAVVQVSDGSAFWSHLRRCSRTRSPVVSELALSTRRAGAIEVQLASTPVFDVAGNATAFRTTFTDITEQKRAEREVGRLRALEAGRRAQFEAAAAVGLALTKALANRSAAAMSEALQTVVDQAMAATGAEFAALGLHGGPDEPFQSWIHSGMDAEAASAIGAFPRAVGVLGALVRTGRPTRLRDLREHPAFLGFPLHHPSMTSFFAVPVRDREEIVGGVYLSNKRDAAEFTEDDERTVEMMAQRVGLALEVLRLNQHLGDAVRAREDLLAIVSHDLRSPLASIQLSAVMLSRGAPEDGERRKSKKYVDTILRTVDVMKRIIEDLLSAAAIEAGRFTVDARPVNLAAIIADAIQQMAPLALPKALQLAQELAPELPEAICDPPRIAQVLSNLIGNAIKFTGANGEIRVRVTAAEQELRFAVSDTGRGIPAKEVPHLFDRYWKGKTGERRGSGLGLYIAKGIVEAHGGRLWVETEEGAGSTFFFTLPAVGARVAPQSSPR